MEELSDHPQWFQEAFKALDVTPSEVARKLGVENAKIYNIVNGKFKPNFTTIQQVLAAYPRLNANYLLKGQKPILESSGAEIVGAPANSNTLTLPLVVPTDNYANTNPETFTILVQDQEFSYSECVVVRITDSSMLPRYPVGMKLLACPVPVADWDYLNSSLVLVLYRSMLVVRRVKENELVSKQVLTLYADSEDSGFVTVRRDDLRSIWRIINIVGVDVLP